MRCEIRKAMSHSDDDSRITALEMTAAEQARTIDDLSQMVAEQWKALDAMTKKLEALTERFAAVEDGAAGAPGNEKPPHW